MDQKTPTAFDEELDTDSREEALAADDTIDDAEDSESADEDENENEDTREDRE